MLCYVTSGEHVAGEEHRIEFFEDCNNSTAIQVTCIFEVVGTFFNYRVAFDINYETLNLDGTGISNVVALRPQNAEQYSFGSTQQYINTTGKFISANMIKREFDKHEDSNYVFRCGIEIIYGPSLPRIEFTLAGKIVESQETYTN